MHRTAQYEKEDSAVLNIKGAKMGNAYGIIAGFAVGVATGFAWKSYVFQSAKAISKFVRNDNRSYKMVLVVRTELGMGKGKIAAQCAHAALGCYRIAQKLTPDVLNSWELSGQPKIVLKLDSVGEEGLYKLVDEARKQGIASTVIRDAGHTQVERGTATVAGLGPFECEPLDEITGHLKLL